MTKKLTGIDGTRWAFARRVDIPDLHDPSIVYLTRWRVVQTPLFAVLVHAIRRPDADRHPHDHPWSFVSIILRGGYIEAVHGSDGPMRRGRGAGSIGRMRRGQYHRIVDIAPRTLTLVFCGPRRASWGYLVPDPDHRHPSGLAKRVHVDHDEYHALVEEDS